MFIVVNCVLLKIAGMILSERFRQLVSDPLAAIWASNCNRRLEPELVRLSGVQVEADSERLLLFVPLKYGAEFVSNFANTHKLSFLMAIILTNESYQLKGDYLSHRACTEPEVAYQRRFLSYFCNALENQFLPSDRAFQAYFDQGSIAVRMLVREVYEQTPKAGTGKKLL